MPPHHEGSIYLQKVYYGGFMPAFALPSGDSFFQRIPATLLTIQFRECRGTDG